MSRLETLRAVHGKATCDHRDVLVRSIIKPYSQRTRSRIIGGRCQVCGREVNRVVTNVEIKQGIQQTKWWPV